MSEQEDQIREGKLIFVPTPIGNREDITLRALRLLREADLIACEDTRHTGPLMDYYDVHAPLVSYEKFNEEKRSEELVQAVEEGKTVCLVSDAGMPGISDPGAVVLKLALDRHIPFTVLPGPSAGLTAYVASGLGDGRFYFIGFLPRRGQERENWLQKLDGLDTTAIIYESPQRIKSTVEEFGRRWPERRIVLCREWTKTFEERISFLGKEWAKQAIKEKGEFVLLLEATDLQTFKPDEKLVMQRIEEEVDQGTSTKDISKKLADWSGLSKKEIYELTLNITKKKQN